MLALLLLLSLYRSRNLTNHRILDEEMRPFIFRAFVGPPARRYLRSAAAVSADGRPSSPCLCGRTPRDRRRTWPRLHEHHPDQRSNCIMRLRSTSFNATDYGVGPSSRTKRDAREFSTGRRSHHPHGEGGNGNDALPLPALDVAVIL